MKPRTISLKARLGLGAAILGAGTLLTALALFLGLNAVAARLDTALASETRMGRYATLSHQAATFLVVATEVVQTGQPDEVRRDRIAPVVDQLQRTFTALQADTQTAVDEARSIGLDAQSRYGTQSLGLARMQVMLENTVEGLRSGSESPEELRAYIDSFAASFDPLLNEAVNAEALFRNSIIQGIGTVRHRLTLMALAIAGLTVALVATFYLGLVRPQFARLDRLRDAAQRIGQEDFTVALPVTRMDEIGQLWSETNRMAAALLDRKTAVQKEWTRLNETIAERTAELRAANATLAEIDENRRRFFADVSHELRTPLSVILMESQIGKSLVPDAAAAFATIEARVERLNRRIDDLLRVARSESGQLELDVQPVILPDLFQQVIHEVQAESDNAYCAGNRGLAGNSFDVRPQLAPSGTGQPDSQCHSLRARRTRGAARGGEGERQSDPDSQRPRPRHRPEDPAPVFDRFSRGGGSAKGQGFGIGLALARWVIEAQSGNIMAESPLPAPDRPEGVIGTSIRICLPVRKG